MRQQLQRLRNSIVVKRQILHYAVQHRADCHAAAVPNLGATLRQVSLKLEFLDTCLPPPHHIINAGDQSKTHPADASMDPDALSTIA
jgi:hypothetical protein